MEYKKDTNPSLGSNSFAPDSAHAQERKAFYQSLAQRTEKVSTAIYMVTNHIDEREAIKASFRDAALALVLETISLEDFIHPVEEVFQSLTLAMMKLQSLLSLASTVNMVSLTNARILQSELSSIRELCVAGQKYYALATLDDVLKTIYPEEPVPEVTELPNGQTFKALVEAPKKSPSDMNAKAMPEKKETSSVSAPMVKKDTVKTPVHAAPVLNSNRKDAILKLIKDKGEVSIKDISQNFYDCSEKTIQRDINALVEEGRVRKQGDRRWSRYSIGK